MTQRGQYAQQAVIFPLQANAVANGNGSVAATTGYDGALCLNISNGAGTCTVAFQGSFDNFATAQSAQNVGVILASSNAAGTPTGITSRSITNGVISVGANTTYSYQINDIYPYYQAVISGASGLGAGTYVTGCSAQLYAVPA